MQMRGPKTGPCDPIGPLELPHSLHAFHRVAQDDSTDEEDIHTFRGGFWNYFSMGMDAEISYAFHAERTLHPEKLEHLCKACPYTKMVRDTNLPSLFNHYSTDDKDYDHEKTRWALARHLHSVQRDLTHPYVDDGYIEVLGFRNAWHRLILLAPRGHGTRLAQANKIRFEFCKGAMDHTFMRIDGEPWKQPLPLDDETVVIEISHLGQLRILANGNCRSKSVTDPCSPYAQEDDFYDSCEEVEEEVEVEVEVEVKVEVEVEEEKKFGAADTFRIPEGINISCLS